MLAAGCDTGDGTTLAPPDGTPVDVTVGEFDPDDATLAAGGLAVVSPEFDDGEPLPARYSRRDGQEDTPPLRWAGVPPEAEELAVVMVDADADGFVHWVLTGLEPTLPGLDSAEPPPGAVAALNDYGTAGYGGPAPPEGDPPHRYVITLHALDRRLGLEADLPPREAIAAVEAASIASAEITATYG